MSISVLCFSKDRPLQLEAYLRSLTKMSNEPVEANVLYCCSRGFRRAYRRIERLFPKVNFIEELDFKEQVLACVGYARTPLFMFGCDDVVFKRPFEPREALKAFRTIPGLFGFSLRLGREITYSQTRRSVGSRPHFLRTNPFLLWRWRSGHVDWGYPWELACTLYKRQMVRDVLDMIGNLDWAHPNRLEGIVANLLRPERSLSRIFHRPGETANLLASVFTRNRSLNWRHRDEPLSCLADLILGMTKIRGLDLMASYPSARASVLTINRVQDVAKNPVYPGAITTDELLRMWDKGMVLDIDYYASRNYSSAHIGDVRFSHRSETPESTCE